MRDRGWRHLGSRRQGDGQAVTVAGDFRPPVTHVAPGVEVLGLLGAVLTWLPGLAAVWLLWRPAASAFFTPPGFPPAGPSA
jgi:hypothetical protein